MTKNQKKERVFEEMIGGIAVFITIIFFLLLGVVMTFMPNFIMGGGMTQTTFGGAWLSVGSLIDTDDSITNDGFAAGNRVVIDESVSNDLFVATNHLTVKDLVSGSVRGFGKTLIIDGEVEENALLIGSTVWIKKNARIDGNAIIVANEVIFDGEINNSIGIVATEATLNGIFRGTGDIRAEKIMIKEASRFSDTMELHAYNITTEDGIIGSEHVQTAEVAAATEDTQWSTLGTWVWWNIGSVFVSFFIGVVIILAAPRCVARVGHLMHTEKRTTWKNGILFFLAVPTALVLIAMTVIGIPVALLGTIAYILFLYVGKILSALMLGLLLLRSDRELMTENTHQERSVLLQQFIVGALVLAAVNFIPIIGMGVMILAAIWGAGGMVYAYRLWRYTE